MQKSIPPMLRKVNPGGDQLPFEYPLKEALRIYAWRWLAWLAVVSVGLMPLGIYWLMVVVRVGRATRQD